MNDTGGADSSRQEQKRVMPKIRPSPITPRASRASEDDEEGPEHDEDEPLPPATVGGCVLWLALAIATMALLGWSWPVLILLLVFLATWASVRRPELPEVAVITVMVFGGAFLVGQFGGDFAAALSPTPSVTPSPVAVASATPTPTPTATPSPTTTAKRTPRPTPRPTARPTARPTPRPQAYPNATPRPTSAPRTPAPTPRPTPQPTTAGEVDTLPGLTESMVFAAFADYDLDCEPSFYGWYCEFESNAGRWTDLAIESSGSSDIHIVTLSVTDLEPIDVAATLRLFETVTRLPYAGAQPGPATEWLYDTYAPSSRTHEATFGPGHFVLRVSDDSIASLELRAPDY